MKRKTQELTHTPHLTKSPRNKWQRQSIESLYKPSILRVDDKALSIEWERTSTFLQNPSWQFVADFLKIIGSAKTAFSNTSRVVLGDLNFKSAIAGHRTMWNRRRSTAKQGSQPRIWTHHFHPSPQASWENHKLVVNQNMGRGKGKAYDVSIE